MPLTDEKKYQLLLQISQEVRDTLDLDEILNHLLDMIQPVLPYDAAGVFVLNQDLVHSRHRRPREVIASVVWRGFEPRPTGPDLMLSQGKGIIGHVIKTGESLVIPDVRRDPRYVAGREGTLSEIAVPIIRGDRAIGAVNLESNQLSAYRDVDVEVLRFFADAAAISIEKAMLHRQILENERVEEQLRMAQDVQSRLLPGAAPHVPEYEIAGTCISTYEIGGDYFDYIHLAENKLGIVVADVSGEGVPAALIMAAFRALLRTRARDEPEPARLGQALNRLLPDFTAQVDFVTAVYGVLEPASGRLTYANCGHNPPMLFRADGAFEMLKSSGPCLSILEDVRYVAHEVIVEPGDLLLLYTDGVVEIADEAGEEFGVKRLQNTIRRSQYSPVTAIIDEILDATREFSGLDSFRDDFTLVIVRRVGF